MTLQEIITSKEGDHFEFKKAENRYDIDEGAKYLSAMSNHGGGRLVLGVTDKRPRKVVGSKAFSQPESIVRYYIDKLHVRVDFVIYHDDEDNRVLVFEVASRPIGLPVQFEGIAWWRDGDSLVPMPEDVRRAIYAEGGHDFSSDICPEVTIDDLDSKAIKKFRKRWHDHSENKRISTLSDEQLLRDAGAITDIGVTYAALILFGKNTILRSKLPHADVVFEYRSKESAGPAAQREDFQEGFFSYSDRIWELVNLRNDDQYYKDGFHRHPISTFNEDTVREAVLNAVSHRDYQRGGSIFVRQYQNRLVIESPGGFPQGITIENILDRQSARNRLIAEIFRLCGLVERAGQGMNLIHEIAIKEAKPLPDFSGSDAYYVMLTLRGKVISTDMLSLMKNVDEERLDELTTDDYLLLASLFTSKGLDNIDITKYEHLVELGILEITKDGIEFLNNNKTISIKTQSELNRKSNDCQSTVNQLPIDCQSTAAVDKQSIDIFDRKKQILTFITEHNKATTAQLSEFVGLTPGRVRTILQELAADEMIVKVGDYRHTHYKIKNPH